MRKIILLLLVALCVTVSPLAFTGCKSSPASIAYKAESATQSTVKLALKGWADYVAQYHPPASEEAEVKAALEKYKAAALTAVDATYYSVALTSTNSPDAGNAASKASIAAQGASQALADLVNLIRSFGVKI